MNPQYWLMKSEPDVFSLTDLEREKKTWWEGVRNYQARNFMSQKMQPGDLVLFYHSNAQPPGIAGLARVCSGASADPSQFDKKSPYFDPKASPEKPIWACVQVEFSKHFPLFVPLETLRHHPALRTLMVIKKGQRLSIQPVAPEEFAVICQLGQTVAAHSPSHFLKGRSKGSREMISEGKLG